MPQKSVVNAVKRAQKNNVAKGSIQIRWSLNKAAVEFNCDKGFLARRLRRWGFIPGEDGLYSTIEIVKAVHGDVDKERSRKISADADRADLVNAQLRRKLVSKKNALEFICSVAATVRARIATSDLDDDTKDAIYEDLRICFNEKEVTKKLFEDADIIGDEEDEEIEEEVEE